MTTAARVPTIDYRPENPFWVGPPPDPAPIPTSAASAARTDRHPYPSSRTQLEDTKPRLSPRVTADPTRASISILEYREKQRQKEKEKNRPRPSLDTDRNPFLALDDNPFLASSSFTGRGSIFFEKLSEAGSRRTSIESRGGRREELRDTALGRGAMDGVSPIESEGAVSAALGMRSGASASEEGGGDVKPTRSQLDMPMPMPVLVPTAAHSRQSTSSWADPDLAMGIKVEPDQEDIKPVIPVGRKRKIRGSTTASNAREEGEEEPQLKKTRTRASRGKNAQVKTEVEPGVGDAGTSTTVVKTEASQAGPSTYQTSAPTSVPPLDLPVPEGEVDVKAKGKEKGKYKYATAKTAGEVRIGRWRKKCPKSTMERLERVMDQRMFLLDRSDRPEGSLTETFNVLGSTGNVYTIRIGSQPTCDCPDAGKGNIPCKHIIFVFIKVLKLAPSSELWYQKGLLDTELQEIFNTAPPALQWANLQVPGRARAAWLKASGKNLGTPSGSGTSQIPKPSPGEGRKEAIGEDCPVCYEEMTEEDVNKKKLVWDDSDTGCGKALHAECFRNWRMSLVSKGSEVTCVWCRTAWPSQAGKQGTTADGVQYTAGGYMNIADLAGVSRVRDTSSYYQGPIRGRANWEPRYEDD